MVPTPKDFYLIGLGCSLENQEGEKFSGWFQYAPQVESLVFWLSDTEGTVS